MSQKPQTKPKSAFRIIVDTTIWTLEPPRQSLQLTMLSSITGIPINRPNGTFLGIEIVDENFKLTFYNAKKKPIEMSSSRQLISIAPNKPI